MRLKRFFLLLPLTFYLLPCHSSFSQDWQQIKGEHFIVFYSNDTVMAKEVSHKAEIYYNKVATDLGYARYSNFWQWDKRVKIYLYATPEGFQKGSGQPAWSHGVANYTDKTIRSYETSAEFLDSILPHEITHLIFRDFVGLQGQVPLWMDEGVAQWEEDAKRASARKFMKDLVSRNDVFKIQTLTRMDVREDTDKGKVNLFYLEAVSLVDFLVTQYGASSFTVFCRQLRDGKSLDEALRSAYTGSIDNVEKLDEKWRKYATEN